MDTATYVRQGRAADALRPLRLTPHFLPAADGSCLIEIGNTKVICTASIDDKLPPWLRGQDQGWITAEYGMLPASTASRMRREAAAGKQSGRTQEIQRLIGRALRAAVDLHLLGERQIVIDCDVLQADGGTRTASITGAYVALSDAVDWLRERKLLVGEPLTGSVSAISVGIVDGRPLLDLCYDEDVNAEVDMNIVCTGDGRLIEVQGTAEGTPFSRAELNALLDLAELGGRQLFELQRTAVRSAILTA